MDNIPDHDFKNDALARKVTRFLLIFQISTLVTGIIFILVRLNPLALFTAFLSLAIFLGAPIWLYIRYLTFSIVKEQLRRNQLAPFTFIFYLQYTLDSRGLLVATTGIVITSMVFLGSITAITESNSTVKLPPASTPIILSVPTNVIVDTVVPFVPITGGDNANCDPSYPSVCIPPPPPDLNCADIPYRNFRVFPPDPHHFDYDKDGIGCKK
jgi:hypothetical protein